MAVDILRKPLACIFHPQVWSTMFLRIDEGHLPCWFHLHVQQLDSLLYCYIHKKLYRITTHWIPILYRKYCAQKKIKWYFNEKLGPESLLRSLKLFSCKEILILLWNPTVHYCSHTAYHRTVSWATYIHSKRSHYIIPKSALKFFVNTFFVTTIQNNLLAALLSRNETDQPLLSAIPVYRLASSFPVYLLWGGILNLYIIFP
jgi:hypothetical protein